MSRTNTWCNPGWLPFFDSAGYVCWKDNDNGGDYVERGTPAKYGDPVQPGQISYGNINIEYCPAGKTSGGGKICYDNNEDKENCRKNYCHYSSDGITSENSYGDLQPAEGACVVDLSRIDCNAIMDQPGCNDPLCEWIPLDNDVDITDPLDLGISEQGLCRYKSNSIQDLHNDVCSIRSNHNCIGDTRCTLLGDSSHKYENTYNWEDGFRQ